MFEKKEINYFYTPWLGLGLFLNEDHWLAIWHWTQSYAI